MELMLKNEAYIFLGTISGGFLLGFVCDLLGFSQCKKSSNIVFIGMRDVLFCLCMALISFIIIYTLNNGEIRWYEILGITVGFVLYTVTVKKYILITLDSIKKAIYKTISVMIKPFLRILKLFKLPYTKLKNALKKVKTAIKTVKYKQNLKIKQIKYIFKKI